MTKNSQKDTTGPVGVAQNDKGTSTTVFFNTTDTRGAAQGSSQDYKLQYCPIHGTMTNHLNGVCQKAPDVPGDHEARDSSQADAELRQKVIKAVTPYAFGDDGHLTALSDKDCYQWVDAIMELVQAEVKRAVEEERLQWHEAAFRVDPAVIQSRAELEAGSGEGA